MKSTVIALAGTTIALILAAVFGTFPVAAAEKSTTYNDPVAYCRVFGSVDYPGQRYQGPPTPEWIAQAMNPTGSDPGRVDWRCMDGRVLACIDETMSGHGCEQMSLGRTPGPLQWAYCRQHPNSEVIPLSVMGWNSAYLWDCAGRVPRAHESALRLDRRGFISDEWSAVVPSLLEDDREWLAHLPDKYREQVLSMPAAQVAAYKQNGSWKLFRSDIDELVRNDAALTTGETATPSVTAGSRAAVVCKEMVAKAWVLVRNGRRIEDGNLDLEQVLDCFDDKAEMSRFMDAVDAVEVMAALKTLPITPIHVSSGFFDPNYPPSEDRQHLGIDLLAPVGTSVAAPEDGDVVFNNTAMATVDQAYLVIRNANGGEHVLGHIASPLRIGAHVVAGQEVGTIREWPGQPGRSHLHWGVNAVGVAQAMRDGWGWGRAPVKATEAEATVRGWVNFNSLVSAEQTTTFRSGSTTTAETSTPAAASTAPNGEIMSTGNRSSQRGSSPALLVVKTATGTISVKDFTVGPGISKTTGTFYVTYPATGDITTPGSIEYQIFYFTDDRSFLVAILKEPIGVIRRRASADLANRLGISRTLLCNLVSNVTVAPGTNDEYDGLSLGFPNCPGARRFIGD